jgi:hypothetical protein
MPRYEGLVHILWELPFPLRLPPVALFCWEPGEGVALFDPRPEVGDLSWRRASAIVQAADVFADTGPRNELYPTHDYLVVSKLRSGQEVPTARLTAGAAGGFVEVRPYTVANIFLCVRQRADYASPTVLERAEAALNNILDVYRFVTLDPLVRAVKAQHDCYYTMVSVADMPVDADCASRGDIDPRSALEMVSRASFGSSIGVNRAHRIGLNSLEDLHAGDILPAEFLSVVDSLLAAPSGLEVFHQLLFSAIRRLKRGDESLSVLDAQSALESLVAVVLSEALGHRGKTASAIEAEMAYKGQFHSLQRRLEEIDRIAAAETSPGGQPKKFLGSPEEARWRTALYGLRNRIVHQGLRTVSFAEAKGALVAGLHAIHKIQDLAPSFGRDRIWSGGALDLSHIQNTSGRISRIFET